MAGERYAAGDESDDSARRVQRFLRERGVDSGTGPAGFALRAPDGAVVELPPVAVLVLYDVLERLDTGTDVPRTRRGGRAAGREDPLLTTQQAADLLSVSRPFLIKLLGEGAIPFIRTGAHRRIRRSAVLAYRARRDAQERRAVDELTRQAVEMGLYDVDVAPEDLLESITRIREERLERG